MTSRERSRSPRRRAPRSRRGARRARAATRRAARVGASPRRSPARRCSRSRWRSSRSPTRRRRWSATGSCVDAAGGLLVGVIGVVGARQRARLARVPRTHDVGLFGPARRHVPTTSLLFAFWAVLLAVPLAGNLGAAWLLVEATTAASALLVGFSGKPRALEAGWKYLILTSLGLGVALLGIVLLAAGVAGGGLGALSWRALAAYAPAGETALVAYLLLLAGLAAKIGWAPVHNWLPDAHSEAPPPVSALLSAALLPAVLLVAWRSEQALAPVVGDATGAGRSSIGFGLVSLAVAVPFLWRPLAVEAAARLLEPRAHGRDRARHRLRDAARARRRRHPHRRRTRSRRRSASTRRRRCSGTSRAPPATRSRGIARTQPGARRDDGHLARHARRPAALAALRQRGADRRRRLPGRPLRGPRRRRRVLLALGFLGLAHALIETTVGKRPAATPRSRAGPARR